tara:strand:- start:812 stop:1000 length:189 start_codon:yes stop_codon:yes gene_type:complete
MKTAQVFFTALPDGSIKARCWIEGRELEEMKFQAGGEVALQAAFSIWGDEIVAHLDSGKVSA